MKIIPAIDLMDGKVVRLTQGDYQRITEYSDNPVKVAKSWQDKGATYLHIVDLEGAKAGKPRNLVTVKNMVKALSIKVQLGGGIRSLSAVEKVLKIGVNRVVLGTAIVEDHELAKKAIQRFGDKVVFSMDVRNQRLRIQGWTKESGDILQDSLQYYESIGLQRIIYTDIAKDGMMKGPNFESLKEILKTTQMKVISSGGISSLRHIIKLKEFVPYGLEGAIVGKSLYEGTIDLKEALKYVG